MFFPKYFTRKAIICFVAVLVICSLFFIQRLSSIQWIIWQLVEVLGFFYFSNILSKRWAKNSNAIYQKRLFWTSFGIRAIWVFFSYFYFIQITGIPFEFESRDAQAYHQEAKWFAGLWKDGKLDVYFKYIGTNYSDMGYPIYLGILNRLVGDSVLIPRLIKALLGSFTSVMIYKISRNNFGEAAGRIAGILAMLLPNLIYYCGIHVKETEMVFLTVAFIWYSDKIFRSNKIIFWQLIVLFILSAAVFLFRTVLAATLLFSFGLGILFISKHITNLAKRMIIVLLLGLSSVFIVSSPFGDELSHYYHIRKNSQKRQMTNYTNDIDGNKFAKYGSMSVFLPMILIAPFPTLVDTNQPNLSMLAGGFFTRNIYVFFVLMAIVVLFKRKLFRNHVLIISVLFTYLFILSASGFALSERFHLPIVPFLLIFASYGITQMNQKNKKYYIPYLVIISFIIIGWNWFKIAGRV